MKDTKVQLEPRSQKTQKISWDLCSCPIRKKRENTILYTKKVNAYSEFRWRWDDLLNACGESEKKKKAKREKESKEDVGKKLTVIRQDIIAF